MKDKQYTIQGVKLTMGEMTLGQDKKLIRASCRWTQNLILRK